MAPINPKSENADSLRSGKESRFDGDDQQIISDILKNKNLKKIKYTTDRNHKQIVFDLEDNTID